MLGTADVLGTGDLLGTADVLVLGTADALVLGTADVERRGQSAHRFLHYSQAKKTARWQPGHSRWRKPRRGHSAGRPISREQEDREGEDERARKRKRERTRGSAWILLLEPGGNPPDPPLQAWLAGGGL